MRLMEKTIHGFKVDIHVSDDGDFTAGGVYGVEDPHKSFHTLRELLNHLKTTLKRAKREVAIPVTFLDTEKSSNQFSRGRWVQGRSFRQVTLVGIHGGTGAFIFVDDETGKREQADRYNSSRTVTKRLTPELAGEYAALRQAEERAEKAKAQFLAKWEIRDPCEAIRKALKETVDDPKEPEVVEDEDPR
jgi:hypothetical protein